MHLQRSHKHVVLVAQRGDQVGFSHSSATIFTFWSTFVAGTVEDEFSGDVWKEELDSETVGDEVRIGCLRSLRFTVRG